jgi:hypothetical protein
MECLESGAYIDIIYTYFEKAFDNVPHRRLSSKIELHGVNKVTVMWMFAVFQRLHRT